MNEIGPKFNHQECFSCGAAPHCGANRLADEFIKHILEPELDEIHLCLNALTSELFTSTVDRDSIQFRGTLEAYLEIATSAHDLYQLRMDSMDQLIDDGITAHRLFSKFDLLIDVDEEIVKARDRFIDDAQITPTKAPTLDKVKSAITDVIDFQADGECYQL